MSIDFSVILFDVSTKKSFGWLSDLLIDNSRFTFYFFTDEAKTINQRCE